jgi:WD40 repeat protein
MKTTRACRRHQFTAALYVSFGLLLSACGGASDPAAPEPSRGALASERTAEGKNDKAGPKRRARSDARKGVTAIAVSPDGASIGATNSDGRVRVLEASDGRDKKLLKAQGAAAAVGLIFSPDGRYLVSVGRDSVAQSWNVETGDNRFTLRGHEHPLRSVAAGADGEETRVMVWDGTTGRLKRILSGHTDFVNAVSVSPDGRLLASGDADARILVWDIASGRLLHTLRGHADELNAVVFSADGKLLASAGEDGKVILWDTAAGRQVNALAGHLSPVRSLAFNQGGGLLAAGTTNGRVLVWDMATRTVTREFQASNSAVNAVAFGGNKLFAGTEEELVRSWGGFRNGTQ